VPDGWHCITDTTVNVKWLPQRAFLHNFGITNLNRDIIMVIKLFGKARNTLIRILIFAYGVYFGFKMVTTDNHNFVSNLNFQRYIQHLFVLKVTY